MQITPGHRRGCKSAGLRRGAQLAVYLLELGGDDGALLSLLQNPQLQLYHPSLLVRQRLPFGAICQTKFV